MVSAAGMSIRKMAWMLDGLRKNCRIRGIIGSHEERDSVRVAPSSVYHTYHIL